jgi:hypothetical protein
VPTLLEQELEGVSRTLSILTHKLHRVPMLQHLTDIERKHLADALKRAESRLFELGELIGEESAHAR